MIISNLQFIATFSAMCFEKSGLRFLYQQSESYVKHGKFYEEKSYCYNYCQASRKKNSPFQNVCATTNSKSRLKKVRCKQKCPNFQCTVKFKNSHVKKIFCRNYRAANFRILFRSRCPGFQWVKTCNFQFNSTFFSSVQVRLLQLIFAPLQPLMSEKLQVQMIQNKTMFTFVDSKIIHFGIYHLP